MHHPVGEFHLVDQVSSTVNGMLLRVPDVIERMEHILNNPVVPIEGKRALEHNRSPVHDPGLHAVALLIPEIDINSHEFAAARGTFFTSPALNVHEGAAIAGCHVVDDGPFSRVLFNATEKVHQHTFPGAAPPDNPNNLPFRDLE
jgi:hypothetical protein